MKLKKVIFIKINVSDKNMKVFPENEEIDFNDSVRSKNTNESRVKLKFPTIKIIEIDKFTKRECNENLFYYLI